MLSPQPSKTNLFLKASKIPKLPRSLNTSPRAQGTAESFGFESAISTQTSMDKSLFNFLIKCLEEVDYGLDTVALRCKGLDRELWDLVKKCKGNVRGVKDKVLEYHPEDGGNKSMDILHESSIILKPDSNEYCTFLEFLVSYEQGKSEMIIQKTKFPKVRMKEIDKALNEEFSVKGLLPSISKQSDSNQVDKMIKESKLLVKKIKTTLSNKSQLAPDIEQLLEVSESLEDFISLSSLEGQSLIEAKSFLEESRVLSEEKKKLEDLYEALLSDHQDLNSNYSHLLTRLNKQVQVLKFQSQTLSSISQSLSELRFLFEISSKAIKDNISSLIQKFSKTHSVVLTKKFYCHEQEKENLVIENSRLNNTVKDLKRKLQQAQDELENCKKPTDDSDSLDLDSNFADMIEMQKLKDQIRTLNYKIYESSNLYSKDLESYKSVISRLRSQIFAQEERIRSLNSKLCEVFQEKEKLLDEVSRFNCCSQNLNLAELQVPEVSADKSSKVRPSDVLEILTDELEDIVNVLKSHNLFSRFHDNNVSLLRKAAEFLAGLKDEMIDDSKCFEDVLENLVKERCKRLSGKLESFKDCLQIDSVLKDKQMEIYRMKVKDKKGQIEMIKQQNDYLKRTVKDLQAELAKVNPVDAEGVRQLFVSVVKEIPALKVGAEQMLLVYMRSVGLSQAEIANVNLERRVKL